MNTLIHRILGTLKGVRENGAKGAIFISKTIGIIAMLSILHGTALAQNHPLPITDVWVGGDGGTSMGITYNDQGDTDGIKYCWTGTFKQWVYDWLDTYGYNHPFDPRHGDSSAFHDFANNWQSLPHGAGKAYHTVAMSA